MVFVSHDAMRQCGGSLLVRYLFGFLIESGLIDNVITTDIVSGLFDYRTLS